MQETGISISGSTVSVTNGGSCGANQLVTWNGVTFALRPQINVSANNGVGQTLSSGSNINFNDGLGTSVLARAQAFKYDINNTGVTAGSYAPAPTVAAVWSSSIHRQ